MEIRIQVDNRNQKASPNKTISTGRQGAQSNEISSKKIVHNKPLK